MNIIRKIWSHPSRRKQVSIKGCQYNHQPHFVTRNHDGWQGIVTKFLSWAPGPFPINSYQQKKKKYCNLGSVCCEVHVHVIRRHFVTRDGWQGIVTKFLGWAPGPFPISTVINKKKRKCCDLGNVCCKVILCGK